MLLRISLFRKSNDTFVKIAKLSINSAYDLIDFNNTGNQNSKLIVLRFCVFHALLKTMVCHMQSASLNFMIN